MPRFNIAISERSYRHARAWAARQGVSVSAVVKCLIETLPEIRRAARAFPLHEPDPANRALSAKLASPK